MFLTIERALVEDAADDDEEEKEEAEDDGSHMTKCWLILS